MGIQLSGLATNFDWLSLVDQLAEAERLPQKRLLEEQDALEQRNNAYGSIVTNLKVLKNRVATLNSPDLFNARSASTHDASAATATASAGALTGTYVFQFTQLATAARQLGAAGVGRALSEDADVSDVSLAAAGFATAITPGVFRVNGAEVHVAAEDTLQDVFDKISAATGGAVAASYDPAGDRIRLESDGEITLGSVTDTSNFLEVAKLHNNGTGLIESGAELGGVRLGATLADANLATAITFGSESTGSFKINGVSIAFSATDTVDAVLKRINESGAGVSATYDTVNDRFLLRNTSTGDVGIALEDVEGNFLAATGLIGGTLERGRDLVYTVNGGDPQRSRSNTISEASSGLTGLSVTALKEGASATITVSSDTQRIKDAITGFIDAYNSAQSYIASQTASSTDKTGKVTASVLASEGDAESIASTLRRLAYGTVEGLSGALKHLEAFGIKSNSNDDTLTLDDPAKLEDVLKNRLAEARDLWTHPTQGLAQKLDSYLERMVGDEGVLAAKQDTLSRQASDIDAQIAELERIVQANRSRMMDSFIAMETAQSNINQQMQFLMQRFGSAS